MTDAYTLAGQMMLEYGSDSPEYRVAFALQVELQAGRPELQEAAYNLYMAGRWEMPLSQKSIQQQKKLWEDLRDALGLGEGHATKAGIHSSGISESKNG